jgi:hypothetical protein
MGPQPDAFGVPFFVGRPVHTSVCSAGIAEPKA